jgi:phosphatidylglycerophosphate synthase
LTQGLYVAAALAAAQHGVVYRDPFLCVIAGAAILSYLGMAGQSKGGVVEQLQAEAAGLPKNTIAVMRLLILFTGVLQLAFAASGVASLFISYVPASRAVFDPLLMGIAFTALQASDYIVRTNPVTPGKGGRGKLVNVPQM